MTPYLEVRTLPPAPRWITAIVAALLVVPVGALLPGGTTSGALRALAMLAIVVLAPLLGLALARPRQTVTISSTSIVRRTTGRLPSLRPTVEQWPLSAARGVELEELGTPHDPAWGVCVQLGSGTSLQLRSYRDRDFAQDTVDHLVLLGIPGHSRAEQRAAELTAAPPSVWL